MRCRERVELVTYSYDTWTEYDKHKENMQQEGYECIDVIPQIDDNYMNMHTIRYRKPINE